MSEAESVAMRASVRVPSPFRASDLANWFKVIPDEAAVDVSPHEGGTQRDPYTTAYTFTATWVVPA